MKVLFATYPMAFHTPGGGEMQLLAYQKHLSAYGVDVTLFDPWNPRLLEHDIVHYFSCVGGSIHFCNFVKQLGLPLVVSSSLWITEESKHLYPVDEIRAQLDLADKVIANSDIECEALSEVLGLPREKLFTVYNGIDDLFLKPVSPEVFRNRFGIHGPFILNVGNIEPRKNQLTLVRAMKNFPSVKIVLIGHQRDIEYSKVVLDEGRGQVVFLGPMAQDEIMLSAYSACDVFCLPSTLETPGLAALEAAAQGARLLVTREGSCREYFGESADYIDPGSINSLSDAIKKILMENSDTCVIVKNDYSPGKFLWRKTTRALIDLYKHIA